MHHVIVTRVAVVLTVLLLLLATGFAALVDRSPGTSRARVAEGPAADVRAEGAALFERYCNACHQASELRAVLAASDDPAALRSDWQSFLQRHGRASGEQDRAILEFLAAQAGPAGGR